MFCIYFKVVIQCCYQIKFVLTSIFNTEKRINNEQKHFPANGKKGNVKCARITLSAREVTHHVLMKMSWRVTYYTQSGQGK